MWLIGVLLWVLASRLRDLSAIASSWSNSSETQECHYHWWSPDPHWVPRENQFERYRHNCWHHAWSCCWISSSLLHLRFLFWLNSNLSNRYKRDLHIHGYTCRNSNIVRCLRFPVRFYLLLGATGEEKEHYESNNGRRISEKSLGVCTSRGNLLLASPNSAVIPLVLERYVWFSFHRLRLVCRIDLTL